MLSPGLEQKQPCEDSAGVLWGITAASGSMVLNPDCTPEPPESTKNVSASGHYFVKAPRCLGSLQGQESPHLLLLCWTSQKGSREGAGRLESESCLTLCNSTSLHFSFLTRKKWRRGPNPLI